MNSRFPASLVRRASLILIIGSVALNPALALADCPHQGEAAQPTLATVAGTGFPGTHDGAARTSASFIEPSGIAVAPDGSVYVADAGAHAIRRITNGVVTTVAGSSAPGATLEQRIGGYLDGPSMSAKFNRPVGVAVGKDGAVYVADSGNHAVRKIQNGAVTTLTRDLSEPRAIALDDDGIVFVADRGTGVRAIMPDGKLSPVDAYSAATDRSICGLAVTGKRTNRMLAYTDTTSIHLVMGATQRAVKFDETIDPPLENKKAGSACGIAIVNRDAVIVSDLFDNAIRLVRFRLDGIVGAPAMVRTIAAGRDARDFTVGGYVDGPSAEARVDVPRALAFEANGTVVFADSGNRRIRRIVGLDGRGPISPDGSGTLAIPTLKKSNYRVVVIGNSYAFTNAMWMESIPGQIEQGLIESKSSGLTKCPDIAAFRVSAGGIGDLSDFITSYYGDGEADLVVFLLDGANVSKEIQRLIKLEANPADPTNPNSAINLATGWHTSVPKQLRELGGKLAKSGTKLALAFIPDGRSVSPLENQRGDSLPPTFKDFYSSDRPAFLTYKMAREYESVLASSGVRTIGLLDALVKDEEGAIRTPLFEPNDYHPSPAGNVMIGKAIAAALKEWRPWR